MHKNRTLHLCRVPTERLYNIMDSMMLMALFSNEAFQKLASALVGPLAKEIGITLSDAWVIAFSNFHELAEKKRNPGYIQNAVDFMECLSTEILKIPPDNLRIPQMHLLGPAFDASKYYFEQEEHRKMFANLIASACDDRKLPSVHPSFVEVLKQLSILDAEILSFFRKKKPFSLSTSMTINGVTIHEKPPAKPLTLNTQEQVYPIVEIWLESNDGQVLLQKDVFIELETDDIRIVAAAIGNLSRLGLLEISYSAQLSNDPYEKFFRHSYFNQVKNEYVVKNDFTPGTPVSLKFVNIRGNVFWANSFKGIHLKKGMVRLSPYGYDFSMVCIDDKVVEPIF